MGNIDIRLSPRCSTILKSLKFSNKKPVSATDQLFFAAAMFLSLSESMSPNVTPTCGEGAWKQYIYSWSDKAFTWSLGSNIFRLDCQRSNWLNTRLDQSLLIEVVSWGIFVVIGLLLCFLMEYLDPCKGSKCGVSFLQIKKCSDVGQLIAATGNILLIQIWKR